MIGRSPALVAAEIDRHIEARLAAAKVPLSPQADDADFIRRATLDITGRIPVDDRVLAFLNDRSPDRRAKLVDELLANRQYGEHFATVWYYRMIKLDNDNKRLIIDNKMLDWLADRFNNNQAWDRLVTDLLTASGKRDKNPETTFFLAHVVAGQPDPSRMTAAVSRLFLGVRLECCECHNHPFTNLEQIDFWGMAAFFTAARGIDRNNKVPEFTIPVDRTRRTRAARATLLLSAVSSFQIAQLRWDQLRSSSQRERYVSIWGRWPVSGSVLQCWRPHH